MYGIEANGTPPSKIFNKENAEDALKNANFCFKCVDFLFKSFKKIK
ncbi:MAG: hypothetical protein ACTSRI_13815 [Promethearchaeota archaeon]